MTCRRVVVREFGGPACIEVVEEAVLPEPGPGQIRVRGLAAGTGFTDAIVREGQCVGVKEKPPCQAVAVPEIDPDGKSSCLCNAHTRREKRRREFVEGVQTLFDFLKAGKLKPAVAARLPLEQAGQAHRLVDNGEVQGKILLVMAGRDPVA